MKEKKTKKIYDFIKQSGKTIRCDGQHNDVQQKNPR